MGRNFNILLFTTAIIGGVALLTGTRKTWVNYYGQNTMLSYNYPRGVRNNNPGNIRITKINWKNKVPVKDNTDKIFEQYYTYTDGVRALMIDISTKIDKYHTIEKIIPIYAPPTENNTKMYIYYVEKKIGVTRSKPLVKTESTIKNITKSIIEIETGKAYYTDSIINLAFQSLLHR